MSDKKTAPVDNPITLNSHPVVKSLQAAFPDIKVRAINIFEDKVWVGVNPEFIERVYPKANWVATDVHGKIQEYTEVDANNGKYRLRLCSYRDKKP